MRVNIYNEEFTGDFQVVMKTAETGQTFVGARFFDGDDRSAVTFWSDNPAELEEMFRKAAFELIRAIAKPA